MHEHLLVEGGAVVLVDPADLRVECIPAPFGVGPSSLDASALIFLYKSMVLEVVVKVAALVLLLFHLSLQIVDHNLVRLDCVHCRLQHIADVVLAVTHLADGPFALVREWPLFHEARPAHCVPAEIATKLGINWYQ